MIRPGKAGTVASREVSVFNMGDGTGKPCRIIKEGMVWNYVGIGWIEGRIATQADADTIPVIAYPGDERPHQVVA